MRQAGQATAVTLAAIMRKYPIYILFLFVVACSTNNSKKELKTSYDISIEILTKNIKQKGQIIEFQNHLDSVRLKDHYRIWKLIEANNSNINLFLSDSLTSDSEEMDKIVTEYNRLQVNFNDNIDTSFVNRLLIIPSIREVKSTIFPKQFLASKLLYNLEFVTDYIMIHNESSEGSFGTVIKSN